MSELQRITSQYVEYEDRIRLTGENPERDVVTLWLTQRLLNRHIGPLVQWLERSRSDNDAQPRVTVRQTLEQTFIQQHAAQVLTLQTPVPAIGSCSDILVNSVDLKSGARGVRLLLKDRDNEITATLTLGVTPLRQWLAILLSQHKVAQWSLSVWPQWMLDARHQTAPQQMRMH